MLQIRLLANILPVLAHKHAINITHNDLDRYVKKRRHNSQRTHRHKNNTQLGSIQTTPADPVQPDLKLQKTKSRIYRSHPVLNRRNKRHSQIRKPLCKAASPG